MTTISNNISAVVILAIAIAIPFIGLSGALDLLDRWVNDEAYGHGFVILFVAGYMFLSRLPDIDSGPQYGQFWGALGFVLSMAMLVISQAAQIHTFSQYLIVAAFSSLAVARWGLPVLTAIAPSVLLLAFAIPLPNFIQTMLTADLQLLSSSLGVSLLKLAQVPVFLQGNVIDLGVYKLQVVEACAGLNYLFPLFGIALILACYLRSPMWQRILLVASAVPITVFFNSIRIAITGLLVKNYGSEAADGFVHSFEGWLIFVACLFVLLVEVWLFARLINRHALSEDLDFDLQAPTEGLRRFFATKMSWQQITCAATCVVALGVGQMLSDKPERLPNRPAFALYPMQLGDWSGIRGRLSVDNLLTLGLTDYLVADYETQSRAAGVELFMAYYDSQKHNGGMHSPKVCLPGGGWDITNFATQTIDVAGELVYMNRATLQRGLESRLIYYWFQQGERTFANELAVKVDVLRRSLLENTTNGALIRLGTPIQANETLAQADARLLAFLELSLPQFDAYIPK